MSTYDGTHGVKRKPPGSPGSVGGRFDGRDRPDGPDMDLAAPSSLEDALAECGGRLVLTGSQLGWDDETFVRSVHAIREDDGATTITVACDVRAAAAVEHAGLTDKGRGAVYVATHRDTISRLLQSLYGLERAPRERGGAYAHTAVFPAGTRLDGNLDWMRENCARPLGEEMSRPTASLGDCLASRCEIVDDANVEAGTMYAFAEAGRSGRDAPDDGSMTRAAEL
ncbi:MAG: hypothetical protein LKI58_03995 [Actinomyces sp.]|jgi:hypothetical protein|nr:hypothetical protein [Actinomyces sp.]MCI1787219.1 hypothetical protein [Actinomyces sp.]MCI1829613.1 hypothetical protein [Actinomyces sp.]MCI1866690.1 hypothetical protein [Actinomyces sp.]